jgi:hypothetical protein
MFKKVKNKDDFKQLLDRIVKEIDDIDKDLSIPEKRSNWYSEMISIRFTAMIAKTHIH